MSPTKTTKKKPAAKKAPARKAAPKKPATTKKAAAPKAAAGQPYEPKPGEIGHIEIAAPDIHAAAKNYSQLFGWQIFPFQPDELFYRCSENLGGCIIKGEPTAGSSTVLYMTVDDIEKTIARGEAL